MPGIPRRFCCAAARSAELFTEGSFPVGLVPEAEYAAARAKLEPGDTLVLFSDGVTEAAEPGRSNCSASRACSEVLAGQHDAPLDQLAADELWNRWRVSARGASQADDITLLLVRYRAAAHERASAQLNSTCPQQRTAVLQ